MILELRQYLIARGRMTDHHARMKGPLPPILARHGVRVVGRWVALSGPRQPMFCYILQWRDFAEREACWAGFYTDPEWARVRAETNAGSELVEQTQLYFLRPHPAFTDMGEPGTRSGGLHQMIIQRTAVGQDAALADFLAQTWLPRLRAAGAQVMLLANMISGPDMPALVAMLAWPDAGSWAQGWSGFVEDPVVSAAFAQQRSQLGTTLLASSEIMLMEPAAYALPLAVLTAGAAPG